MSMVRHSKIQKQILGLYREFLHVSKTQPDLGNYVRSEFKKNAKIPRTHTIQIEQIYRRGQRQLEMLKREDVKGAGVFTKLE